MAKIVNLRRARKAKARAESAAQDEGNRVEHGVAKKVRDLAKARSERAARNLEVHKLERDD